MHATQTSPPLPPRKPAIWHLPVSGVIRRETTDHPVSVLECRNHKSMALRVSTGFSSDRKDRLVLRTPWGPELHIQLKFDRPAIGDRAIATVVALFSTDRGIVESFVREVLGGSPPGSLLAQRGPGWYLWCEPKRQQGPWKDEPRHADQHPKRREPRIPVRVAVHCAIGGRLVKGKVCNVSKSGMFLTAVLPKGSEVATGSSIRIRFPVTLHIRPVDIVIEATVCWCSGVSDGSEPTGIGVQIASFGEEADRGIWTRFVDNEQDLRPDRIRVVTKTNTRQR